MGLFKDLFGFELYSNDNDYVLSDTPPRARSAEENIRLANMMRGTTKEEERAIQLREAQLMMAWRKENNENTKTL